MKILLKVVACFSLIISLSSNATTVVLEWSGTLQEIVIDNGNTFFSSEEVGAVYNGQFSFDPVYTDYAGYSFGQRYAWFWYKNGQADVSSSQGNLSSSISFSNNKLGKTVSNTLKPFNSSVFSNIFNSPVTTVGYDQRLYLNGNSINQWTLDGWNANGQSESSVNNPLIRLQLISTDEFANQGTFMGMPPIDFSGSDDEQRAIFWLFDENISYPNSPNPAYESEREPSYAAWGYLDQVSVSEVPLPAGIYLFLSGIVGLGLMRGRNA